jgi:putative peptidoglycan lipid II flippase
MGFHWYGAAGLALASDGGIALQAIALGLLLHQRRMVSLASLEFAEMGRCLLAGLAAGGVVWLVFVRLFREFAPLLGENLLLQARWIDLAVLLVGGMLWVLIAKGVLEATGSALPRVMIQRLRRR